MAKSLLTILVQTSRAIERDRKKQQRASAREYSAALRQAERARKAEKRAMLQMEKADLAELKAFEKAAKTAHIETMKATENEQNALLKAYYDDIDCLLQHTLDIDDYVDLEKLRRTYNSPAFDAGTLNISHKSPVHLDIPAKPVFDTPKAKGIFGRKKKLALATEKAKVSFEKACSVWEAEVANLRAKNIQKDTAHATLEKKRLGALEEAKKQFGQEVIEHNEKLDSLINNLGYGAADAIEEYVSIVVSNSAYPEHFQVDHRFTFDPNSAELKMKIVIPPPGLMEDTKAYKYKQSTDEIDSSTLSLKAQKDRYNGAVHQVAIRSFHEIFEADRRGIIKTMSVQVGTETALPATGQLDFIPFVAVAASRETFIEFDLSSIVLIATLKHLGAAISKNPFELVGVNPSGVRYS